YAAEVLTVRLDSGAAFRVFLKNFGLSARPKDGPRQRREREVRVYRELLAGAGLGTAGYYGSVLDEARGRLWLLLEYVDGTPGGGGRPVCAGGRRDDRPTADLAARRLPALEHPDPGGRRPLPGLHPGLGGGRPRRPPG